LAYDSNKLSDLRVKLKEKFSKKEGELKAVCNLVPKISEVVGLGEEETRKRDQGKSEGTRSGAFTKMKEGCLLFLQVVCMSSLGAMITLFIDDLQWGDVASIDLIKDIATDDDNNSLLFVGAYRDNEVDDVHPLAVQLRQLEAMGSITNVQLYIGELDLVSVNKIIADAMHSTSMEPLKELANIVYKKTEGNAFFLIQFLRGLQKDGLVYYSMEKFSWKWDAATIEAETAVSENIVDFMAGKIRQLVRSSSRHFLILFRDSFTHNY
jgi:predicted ATPase